MHNPLALLRALRADNKPIARGVTPRTVLITSNFIDARWWMGLIIAVIVYGVIPYLLQHNTGISAKNAHVWGWVASYSVIVVFYYQPIVAYLFYLFRYRERPPLYFFNQFHRYQKVISAGTLALFMVTFFDALYPKLVIGWHHYAGLAPVPDNLFWFKGRLRAFKSPSLFYTAWFGVSYLLYCSPFILEKRKNARRLSTHLRYPAQTPSTSDIPFGLWLGQATGQLAMLCHGSAIAPMTNINLSLTDAAQNLLILGAIGSGKTTRAIHPLLIQLFDQACGGLIFDIKGDFKQSVEYVSELTHTPFTVIGIHQAPMNLLAGLTPELAASFLKSAFLVSGGHRQDAFWIDTATELCRNTLGILSFLPLHYSLSGLYHYLFDEDYRVQRNDELDNVAFSLEASKRRLLESYQQYPTRIFNHFDEKVKAGVNASVAQVLSPFNHPELMDAFCAAHADSAQIEAILEGAIYVVDMPLSRWGLGGKVVYNFIKLRFFNMMQQRTTRLEWDQTRAVFFMSDEYQDIVSCNKDGLSDLNFWDKSRSSKTIGIISGQSVSSFYAAIGDRDLTHALLQNFRQKVCFKTEDQATLDLFNRLLGRVEIARVKESVTYGESSQPGHWGSAYSSTETYSLDYTEKPVLDAQTMRGLLENQAVALLSIQGASRDDILNMQPIFI